jgi:CRP-like cAMP-binding protein
MPETITALELSKHPVFEGEPLDTLEWIASLLEVIRFQAGDIVVREGEPVEHLFIILEGELHFRMPGYHSLLVTAAGEATGLLPFSRMKVALVRGIAAQPVRLARMHGRHLRELVYRAPLAAQRLVSKMTERAREFTRMEESSNRLLALGKLAAGLAHELNNPASAAVRSSARLREVLTERRGHALALRTEVLPKQAADLMHELGLALSECHAAPAAMDPIDRADRESDMGDWLESIEAPSSLASGLVDAGFRVDQLSPLTPLVSTRVLGLGLQVLVADHEILCLTRELEETSTRSPTSCSPSSPIPAWTKAPRRRWISNKASK